MTIIGVMPKVFRFLRVDPSVWLSFQFDRSEVYVGNFSYQSVARLRSGVSLEAASGANSGCDPRTVDDRGELSILSQR